jgi:hypothetical protein
MNEDNQHDRSPEEKAPEADEPILNLTEAVNDPQEAAGKDEISSDVTDIDPLAATVELEEGLGDDLAMDQDDDDFVDSLGMEIGAEEEEEEDAADEAADASLPEALDVSPEQLDAALERVIQKMFYDRIDRILVNVIEKRVKREIDRIKAALIDEAGD